MKSTSTEKVCLGVLVFISLIVFGYCYVIEWSGLKEEQFQNLANAGTYFAAVLTPLSFIGVLLVLYKNDRLHKKQAARDALLKNIELIDRDIESSIEAFSGVRFVGISGKDYAVRDLLFSVYLKLTNDFSVSIDSLEKVQNDAKKKNDEQVLTSLNLLIELFGSLAFNFDRLMEVCKACDEILGENERGEYFYTLSVYYGNKYRLPIERVQQAGNKCKSWDFLVKIKDIKG